MSEADNFEIREETLTDKELRLCDLFLQEYSKDYDPEKACLRLGVAKTDG